MGQSNECSVYRNLVKERASDLCPLVIIVSLAFTSKKDCVKEERSIFNEQCVGFRKNVYREIVTRKEAGLYVRTCKVLRGSVMSWADGCVLQTGHVLAEAGLVLVSGTLDMS